MAPDFVKLSNCIQKENPPLYKKMNKMRKFMKKSTKKCITANKDNKEHKVSVDVDCIKKAIAPKKEEADRISKEVEAYTHKNSVCSKPSSRSSHSKRRSSKAM